jgi:hypothetical protein
MRVYYRTQCSSRTILDVRTAVASHKVAEVSQMCDAWLCSMYARGRQSEIASLGGAHCMRTAQVDTWHEPACSHHGVLGTCPRHLSSAQHRLDLLVAAQIHRGSPPFRLVQQLPSYRSFRVTNGCIYALLASVRSLSGPRSRTSGESSVLDGVTRKISSSR